MDEFETKLKTIDELLGRLKSDEISLKESVELYKNGVNLINEATQILQNAKLEISQMQAGNFDNLSDANANSSLNSGEFLDQNGHDYE
ncbi:MAG: exodeoxyribonuclease VII small subunit [Campylobacter sp.]